MTTQHDLPDFGANSWLVDEIYEQFLVDPGSVDPAWHDFFDDYEPGTESGTEPPPATSPATPEPAAAQPSAAPVKADKPEIKPVESKPVESKPAEASPAAEAPAQASTPAKTAPVAAGGQEKLRGAAAKVVTNMEMSLALPTATSVRAVPAKLLSDNRLVVNRHLARSRGGKISFTHLIGYALVQACKQFPVMNNSYAEIDSKPYLVTPEHVNLGLAIDLTKPNGERQLVVAAIKGAEEMDFHGFWTAYEDIIRRARNNKLTAEDFSGVTISLTNPGTIGTVHSVPRLMPGQGTILGAGAMDYPAEYQGMSEETLARLGVSKILTLTSTYDHRIIQGAQSGDFLRILHQLLLGADGFYDDVFASMRVPYEPVRWVRDTDPGHEDEIGKPARVIELIHAFRVRGHLMADTDPLEIKQRSHPDLDIVNHGLSLWDLDREFPTGGFGGKSAMKLRDILGVLRDSYCRTVGIEYMHIQEPEERAWIQSKVEFRGDKPSRSEQLHILGRLNAAEAFETFLQTKFVGQKRFSLEGGESVIALLDAVASAAADSQLEEVVVGMAHRGRLNVLANIVGKSYGQIFREFEGNIDPGTVQGSGDVKYHLGAEGQFVSPTGRTTRVSLTSNPSHLEAVNPVLEGIVRAKQDVIDKGEEGFTVLPVLLHGDAAFAGQGVVAETLQMGQLRGYRTGGTVHVVINNQVGFTTSPAASRSSTYATDVARTVQAPIFHVNGDDPEGCVRVAKLAFEYRQQFKKDAVIDMVCYRRRGHNEGDDPSMTQPLMYDNIDRMRSVRKTYTEALIGRGDITTDEAEEALKDYQSQLERVFAETRDSSSAPAAQPRMDDARSLSSFDTAVSQDVLSIIGKAHVDLPEGFTPHPKLAPLMQRRAQMVNDGGIDWGMGEILAFGSLLLQGTPVRLTGQDSRRGTFVQRHAVLVDRVTAEEYTPLKNLSDDQSSFHVYDSFLSEYACLGFEYGYSVARAEALTLWEAQFGDFVNGAMTIIDEFISSGQAKWGQRSGVVLLLPHGYEGQGPDHSSARIERFLQLCAEDNMTVAYPSTPAQHFHLLRAQALAGSQRPLIVFTPKSMLRLKAASSAPEDFTTGRWQPVISDHAVDAGLVTKVLLCAGKVYYDLLKARDAGEHSDTAIVRVEQLHPVPATELVAELERFPSLEDVVWVQEEPANQGAWPFMALNLPPVLPGHMRLRRASRSASASPAVGSAKVHAVEQQRLVEDSLRG